MKLLLLLLLLLQRQSLVTWPAEGRHKSHWLAWTGCSVPGTLSYCFHPVSCAANSLLSKRAVEFGTGRCLVVPGAVATALPPLLLGVPGANGVLLCQVL